MNSTKKSDYLLGGIEAGGTKCVCAVADSRGNLLKQERVPTTTPAETLSLMVEFFQKQQQLMPIAAMGIGSFGPVDLNKDSKTYGYITATPKPGWRNFDIVGALRQSFVIPIGFDTDVNAAALGEYRFGAARGLENFIYVTVGTGIGGGGMIGGKLMHGLMHPEMGHIFIPHDKVQDPFEGVCPYHKDCLEGLATGPAMMARWNVASAADLPAGHPAWDLEAQYLAYAVANWIMTLSPQRIILGGGVLGQKGLYEKIRKQVPALLNGYIAHEKVIHRMDDLLVAPGLGDKSGILGSIALGELELARQ